MSFYLYDSRPPKSLNSLEGELIILAELISTSIIQQPNMMALV